MSEKINVRSTLRENYLGEMHQGDIPELLDNVAEETMFRRAFSGQVARFLNSVALTDVQRFVINASYGLNGVAPLDEGAIIITGRIQGHTISSEASVKKVRRTAIAKIRDAIAEQSANYGITIKERFSSVTSAEEVIPHIAYALQVEATDDPEVYIAQALTDPSNKNAILAILYVLRKKELSFKVILKIFGKDWMSDYRNAKAMLFFDVDPELTALVERFEQRIEESIAQ